ncbi:MAG: DNA mismatch repair protein MutS, partial [Woeseia sp.]
PGCVNVHLDATEHKGQLVFLHTVKAGPANQSYGLQVASLAGVPPTVIKRARAYMATLESQQFRNTDSPQAQLPLSMTSAAPQADPLRDLLTDTNPDSMSPREALELLYRLKSLSED